MEYSQVNFGKGFPYHAFHAMGKKQANATLSDPFGLAAGNELVDDALRRVVEVTELCFPHDKCMRVGHGETQVKTQDTIL